MEYSIWNVILGPNKDTIFIMEFYKLHKIGRKSTRSSLEEKHKTCMFEIYKPFTTYILTINKVVDRLIDDCFIIEHTETL